MNERLFRLILGGALLLVLLSERADLFYLYIGIITFEGLTNWRIPLLISKIRYGQGCCDRSDGGSMAFKYNVDAERILRLVIAGILAASLFLPKTLWFIPWFVGFALSMAGMTGICPMAILIKKIGFK